MVSNLPPILKGPLFAVVMSAISAQAAAQGVDCQGLQDQLESLRQTGGVGRLDIALRQQRADLERTRSYADDSGCGGGPLDDADSDQCRSLARRVGQLEAGLQRLEAQATRPDPEAEDRRRALTEAYNRSCGGDTTSEPTTTMPVDPDGSAEAPASAPQKYAHVLCVRQCDGAYYPLATDVAVDQMGDMDRICRAQCPAAESSAYSTRDGDEMGKATTADGSVYASLATAFKFQQGTTAGCSCRAPHQSWAEALAGAEALLEPHQGDVTVTPELAAAMARPVPRSSGTRPASEIKPSRKPVASKPAATVSVPDIGATPDLDVMRQIRRSAPKL